MIEFLVTAFFKSSILLLKARIGYYYLTKLLLFDTLEWMRDCDMFTLRKRVTKVKQWMHLGYMYILVN